jgi:hypothetical protein
MGGLDILGLAEHGISPFCTGDEHGLAHYCRDWFPAAELQVGTVTPILIVVNIDAYL